MIELKDMIPGIHYELRYATPDNFTGKQLYQCDNTTFLRLPTAKALRNVQNELNGLGYGLKVFDAYRPHKASKMMWKLIRDTRYVANPAKGSGHNRGLAIDLTIIDVKTGQELEMGTSFDSFTDTAHHFFRQLSSEALKNRALLRTLMEKNGFKTLETEWWHYNWPNNRNYDVLDINFRKLRKFAPPSGTSAPSSSGRLTPML